MKDIRLGRSEEMRPVLDAHLPRIAKRLSELVPSAGFHHIGATAIPGSITKGDVDVLLRVTPQAFPPAVIRLKDTFAVAQPQNWSDAFASFADESTYPFPLGVQMVVENSPNDFFLFLTDYFTAHPDELERLNQLKIDNAARGPEAYWSAKNEFLSAILRRRGQ